MDLIITYGTDEFVIELKIWRGEKNEQSGRETYLSKSLRGLITKASVSSRSSSDAILIGCRIFGECGGWVCGWIPPTGNSPTHQDGLHQQLCRGLPT